MAMTKYFWLVYFGCVIHMQFPDSCFKIHDNYEYFQVCHPHAISQFPACQFIIEEDKLPIYDLVGGYGDVAECVTTPASAVIHVYTA